MGNHENDLSSSGGPGRRLLVQDEPLKLAWNQEPILTDIMFDREQKGSSLIDLCATCGLLLIVSHEHCVPVSSAVNDYEETTLVTYIVGVQIIIQGSEGQQQSSRHSS